MRDCKAAAFMFAIVAWTQTISGQSDPTFRVPRAISDQPITDVFRSGAERRDSIRMVNLQENLTGSNVSRDDPEQSRKLRLENEQRELENEKLRLEIQKLRREQRPEWFASSSTVVLVSVGSALLGAVITVVVARWNRLGTYDQVVLEQRLKCYPELVKATESLAIYFPERAPLTAECCEQMGTALRTCYFSGTGVLLSKESRDWYFLLAKALGRVPAGTTLNSPTKKQFKMLTVGTKMKDCRSQLEEFKKVSRLEDVRSWAPLDRFRLRRRVLNELTSVVDDWTFGQFGDESQTGAAEPHEGEDVVPGEAAVPGETAESIDARSVRDFLLLQMLSSRLRTSLSVDLRGRRRPQ